MNKNLLSEEMTMIIGEFNKLTPLEQAISSARELLTRFDKQHVQLRAQAEGDDDYRAYDEYVFDSGEDALELLRDIVRYIHPELPEE